MNDNRRIAFNTGILYVKLIVATIVGLYVSRQVLLALGADDYGLFAVVGGLVEMMNILGITMSSTSYRYIAVEIGKGADGNVRKVYNTLFVVHLVLAVFILLIGETFGMFYISNYLNVDSSKIPDAQFILHCSLVATFFTVSITPLQGIVIAREKFLYTSSLEIIDTLIKLLSVIWLVQYSGNRLRGYSLILATYIIFLAFGYIAYCWNKERSIIRWQFNKVWDDYKSIFSFTFYLLIGAIACVGRIQGAAVIINWFYGTALNAAFGLASQVNNCVTMFVRTISQAANPQIMKNYGGNNETRSIYLVYVISKVSFMMMLIPVIPFIFYMDDVLTLWLKEPPRYTGIFSALLLINGLVSCLCAGFDANIQATGKLRKNQIGYTIINLMLLPLIWVMYSMGLPAYSNVIAMLLLTVGTIIFQCWIMRDITVFRYNDYFMHTLRPSLLVLCSSIIPLYLIRQIIGSGIIGCLVFCIISTLIIGFSIIFVGLSKGERNKIFQFTFNKIKKQK